MTRAESFALASFTLFSIADLRYRLVPGIELFFFGTVLLHYLPLRFKQASSCI
jgi:hypothetical protein